jgi:hypothetical protein
MTTPILLFPAIQNKNKNTKDFKKNVSKRKRNIASFINTMREKLMPLEIPDWFSHYIFCWLYQRLDLQPRSKRMNR